MQHLQVMEGESSDWQSHVKLILGKLVVTGLDTGDRNDRGCGMLRTVMEYVSFSLAVILIYPERH